MPPETSRRDLPALTITISAAPPGTVCGVGRKSSPHPAVEHYEYSDRGGPVDRCAEHGGQKMREILRAKGHTVVDETAP